MDNLILINSLVLAFSSLCIFMVFCFTPLLVLSVYAIKGEKPVKTALSQSSVSIITVAHNAYDLIFNKIQNSLSLNFPSKTSEIVIFSDGSTDNTEEIVKEFTDRNVRLLSSPSHDGKHSGINKAVQSCSSEILVFSDAGAMIAPDAITNLLKYFDDPLVGGVCGKLIFSKSDGKFKKAQSDYNMFAGVIKVLESKTGSISSNDGSLYCIRKDLFTPVPGGVTDDLFTCLSVVKQGYRFMYEPKAISNMKTRSIKSGHELQRRRRIVARSLHGIYLMKSVLNPFKYGIFSLNLFVNKVIRRCLPIFLISMFFSSLFLSFYIPLINILFLLQLSFYILALSHLILFQHLSTLRIMKRLSSLAYYFCLGNYGTLLGLYDFIRGKSVVKWESIKQTS